MQLGMRARATGFFLRLIGKDWEWMSIYLEVKLNAVVACDGDWQGVISNADHLKRMRDLDSARPSDPTNLPTHIRNGSRGYAPLFVSERIVTPA